MARSRSVYACTHCGAQQQRWHGRCPSCGAWDELIEEPVAPPAASGAFEAPVRDLTGVDPRPGTAKARPLAAIETGSVPRLGTGIPELDRVLGGGLVAGAAVLVGGEPGVGKSTLSLQLADSVRTDRPFLYVTGEESPEQLRLRADRLGIEPERLLVLAETCVESLGEAWREHRPSVVLVDSIQTMRTGRVESAPGSVAQVRESAAQLAGTARAQGSALILIGHVTKDGSLAGPRVLEHLVDVVLGFEGDRGHPFRVLRASKNRFGSTQEVGVFNMTEAGLACVENPSELFLAERRAGSPGSCIAPLVEGTRPMLVEIQALLAPAGYGTARRTSLGLDDARLALLLAVLDRRGGLDVVGCDVYVNAAGGVRVGEPGADLALALALASSRLDLPLPPDAAACGEVGLGGEVRRVGRLDLRVREAARLGFRTILLPAGAAPPDARGANIVEIGEIAEAVQWLREQPAPRRVYPR